MSSLGYYDLQKKIYEKLIGNSQLMAICSGVFDHVPQGINHPFVMIGDNIASDFPRLGGGGVEYNINIHVWSREAGHKQLADIMELIYGLLHNGSITIIGKILLVMEVTSSSIQLENDGLTYHGIMSLRIILIDN